MSEYFIKLIIKHILPQNVPFICYNNRSGLLVGGLVDDERIGASISFSTQCRAEK